MKELSRILFPNVFPNSRNFPHDAEVNGIPSSFSTAEWDIEDSFVPKQERDRTFYLVRVPYMGKEYHVLLRLCIAAPECKYGLFAVIHETAHTPEDVQSARALFQRWKGAVA